MTRLASVLLSFSLIGVALPTTAQTVRFQTTVGTFDMLLNPTNNAGLQPLVDNMLANVAAGIYENNIVNRAPEDFVLQLGGFDIDPADIGNVSPNAFQSNEGFDPVIVDTNGDLTPDIDLMGLSNVRGTVSLALSGGNPNTGSTSFFVNLGDNSFLDEQGFIPFAAIVDMSDINRLVSLDQVNLFPGQQNADPNFTDVPLDADGNLVIVETASVISESTFSFVGPLQQAFSGESNPLASSATVNSPMAPASSSMSLLSETDSLTTTSTAIPEPSAVMLLLLGALPAASRRR